MKTRVFLWSLIFLIGINAVYSGMGYIDLTPAIELMSKPPPENPEFGTPWHLGGILVDVANAIGWIAQIIIWISIKAYGFGTLIYALLTPNIPYGSLSSFGTIVNGVLAVMVVMSLMPFGD